MKRKYAKLQKIDNDHKITWESDDQFLYHLQDGLLLALKEQGILHAAQYRQAAEKLKQQSRTRATESHQKRAAK